MSALGCPWFLLLLLVVPLAAFFYARAGRRHDEARKAFTDKARFAAFGFGAPGLGARLVPVLVILAAALASLALARPLGPPSGDEERSVAMDVIVALDISDSMGVQDVGEDRLSGAKEFIKKLVSSAPDNRYALILFSGDSVITCPPTLDHDAFLTFLEDADFGRANLPGTAIGEAVLTAATRFRKGELPRAVVVVSDGENTYGPEPVKAAESAKGYGLKVYAVGVGTAEGGRIPSAVDFFGNATFKRDRQGKVVLSRLDEAALRGVAEGGGGKYFAASGPGSVKALAKELSAKDDKKVKDPFRGAKEYGPWFALAAGVLVCVAMIL